MKNKSTPQPPHHGFFRNGRELAVGLQRRSPSFTKKGFDCMASNVIHYTEATGCLLWGQFNEELPARPLLIDPYKHDTMFPVEKTSTATARFVWQVMNQLFDCPGFVVRHLCGNSRCLQPVHLSLGTQYENGRDRFLSNRGFILTPTAARATANHNPATQSELGDALHPSTNIPTRTVWHWQRCDKTRHFLPVRKDWNSHHARLSHDGEKSVSGES